MVSALFMLAPKVQANDLGGNLDNNNDKVVVKKTETHYNLTAMPKTTLSLDAGFKASGILKTDFNLSSNNTLSVKSVMTFKKGNVTYIVPYVVQVQEPPLPTMRYHQLQFKLPFRRD